MNNRTQKDFPRATSINGVCATLEIGRTTAYALIAAGELDVLKIGRRTLVTTESIERLIERSLVKRP